MVTYPKMLMLMFAAVGLGAGCVQVKPIKVEPIHITMDVNIRVDKELDEFFDFEEKVKDPGPALDASAQSR